MAMFQQLFLAQRLGIFTRILCVFPQPLQAKACTVLQNRQQTLPFTSFPTYHSHPSSHRTGVYPKVSGLADWSENCKWYSSLPLGASCIAIL